MLDTNQLGVDNLKEANFSIKPVLEGEKVILRPFNDEDWKAMIPILEEYEVRVLTGSVINDEEANEPMSDEEKEKIREWYQTRNEQTDRLDLAVVDKNSGELVGELVFNEYESDTGIVNFRTLFGSNGRNKGFGSEAISLFVKYGFEKLSLHKIQLEVFSFNSRAEHVYVKNGFVLEGVRRQNYKLNDKYYDSKLYGLLRSEY